MITPLLSIKNISKFYDKSMVLNDVSFTLQRESIHALVGENGSGKSTLVNILAGIIPCDSGSIEINENLAVINNPLNAIDYGICLVSQNNTLFDNMTIAENIFVNHEILSGNTRFISWKKINQAAFDVLKTLGLELQPQDLVSSLTQSERKMVEIARGLIYKTKILILDEPTSTMNEADTENLFKRMRGLKDKGISIIYISHRLYEISKIADFVTILRDGSVVDSFAISDYNKDKLIEMIVGENVVDRYPKLNVKIGKPVLSLKNVYVRNLLQDISFDLKKGEILGICGLKGSGKMTLGKALFGLVKITAGQLYVHGKEVRLKNSSDATKRGIAYLSADLEEGIAGTASVQKNIITPSLRSVKRFMPVPHSFKENAKKYFKLMRIKNVSITDKVCTLSSGGKRKVIFAKWLSSSATIFILNDPTSAIDISSKIDIYNILNGLVETGSSVILISTEISEILGMADRILVLSGGRIVKEAFHKKSTREEIMLASTSILEK